MDLSGRRKKVIFLIAIVVVATSVAGFAYYQLNKREPLSIATTRSLGSLPVWVAYEQGLFHKHGLDPTLREFPVALFANRALEAGEVDYIEATPRTMFEHAAETGTHFKLVQVTGSLLPGSNQLIVRQELQIASLEDLNNRTIALNDLSTYCLECFAFKLALNQNGVRANFTQIVYQRMSDSLRQGVVDSAVMTAPYNQLAIQQGVGYALQDPRLGDSGDAAAQLFGGPTMIDGNERTAWVATNAYWATESYLKNKPETAHSFARALAEATAWLSDETNTQRAGSILAHYLGGVTALEAPSLEALKTRLWKSYPDGFSEWEALQRQADLMTEYALLRVRVDVRQFVELPWYDPH